MIEAVKEIGEIIIQKEKRPDGNHGEDPNIRESILRWLSYPGKRTIRFLGR